MAPNLVLHKRDKYKLKASNNQQNRLTCKVVVYWTKLLIAYFSTDCYNAVVDSTGSLLNFLTNCGFEFHWEWGCENRKHPCGRVGSVDATRYCSVKFNPIFKNFLCNFLMTCFVVIDWLDSFRDGSDLNLRQLDNNSDAVLLVCRFTWAETTITTRWDNSIYISFYQLKVLFHIRIASLLWLFCFGKIGIHPIVVFLQLVRFRGWVVMKNNETCNNLNVWSPQGW